MGSLFFRHCEDFFSQMTWVTTRMGIDMFFLSVFRLLVYFFLGQVKEAKGSMNIWIFIWVTELNKLLTNFR